MENPHEVKELRNKLRMMKFPQDDILNTVRKQQRSIDKQKQANETIRQQIRKYEEEAIAREKCMHEYNTSNHRLELEARKKKLFNDLGILQADFKAEDEKRRRLEENVSRARSKAGGMFAQAKENEEIQFRVSSMENRLDQALSTYNRHLKKLDSCRCAIDELRKERFNFLEVYSKLEKEEKEKIDDITEYINISNEYYTIRDQRRIDLVELQKAEKQEQNEDDAELSRINQKIEDQAVLSHGVKNEQVPIPSISSSTISPADVDEDLKNQIKDLSTTLNQILSNAKVQDVDELVKKAQKLESENYSLFNFVVERGDEKAKLIEQIEALERRGNELNMEIALTDEEQNYKLKELARTMSETDNNIKLLTSVKAKNDNQITAVYSKLERLYNNLALSWDDVPDEKHFATPLNAMWLLSNIENYLSNLMKDVLDHSSSIQLQPKEASSSSDPHRLMSTRNLLPSPSRLIDKSADEKNDAGKDILADVIKPLTPDEMRARLTNFLK